VGRLREGSPSWKVSKNFPRNFRKYSGLVLRRAEKALEISLNVTFLVLYFLQKDLQDYRVFIPLFDFT
jgi:hypothetical protein